MAKGKIKWFDGKVKMYGFIEAEDGSEVFVHLSAVQNRAVLAEGDAVEFEVVPSKKGNGMAARNVKRAV